MQCPDYRPSGNIGTAICAHSDYLFLRGTIWRWARWFQTCEVLGIVAATFAAPMSDFRVRTNGASAIHVVVFYMRRDDVLRRRILFHPLNQCAQYIVLRIEFDLGRNGSARPISAEDSWSRSAATVCHSRHHKKPKERLTVLPSTRGFFDALVITASIGGRVGSAHPKYIRILPPRERNLLRSAVLALTAASFLSA
jgi:hypothetical protein